MDVDLAWKAWKGRRFKQVIFFPLLLLLIFFMLVLMPFAYGLHLFVKNGEKLKIRNEIKRLDVTEEPINTPEKKNLESLWNLHGLNRSPFSSKERFRLLKKWIDILYGEEIRKNLELDGKLKDVKQLFEDFNKPYYAGESSGVYNFGDPLMALIDMISNDLPEYE